MTETEHREKAAEFLAYHAEKRGHDWQVAYIIWSWRESIPDADSEAIRSIVEAELIADGTVMPMEFPEVAA